METGIIEIEIRGYDKYKCRKDIVNPQWFKCSNQIFDDDDLYDFSLEEMAVWLYILSQASKQKSKVVRLSVRKAAMRISSGLLRQTIKKLCDLKIVTQSVQVPTGSRPDPVQVPTGIRAQEGIGEERKGEEEEGNLPPPEASPPGAIGELRGDPDVEHALSQVPEIQQRAWLGKYDLPWLKESLIRAIAHGMKRDGVTSPRAITNWQRRLDSWFIEERKAKLKPKPPAPRPRAAPDPVEIPIVTAAEALSNASRSPIAAMVSRLAVTKTMAGSAS